MTFRNILVSCALALTLASCVAPPSPGQDGKSTLMKVSAEPAGSHCPNGGSAINAGLDTNGDGQLDASEVTSTSYVCNGGDGKSTALVNLVSEPAGSHCASGGTAVKSGIDTNGDGTLADSEVTSTAYICNGGQGAQALVSLVPEPPGPNCAAGGTAVKSGLDTNENGTLDTSEVRSTQYICSAGSAFPTKWSYVSTGIPIGEIFSNAFIRVNGPVRIYKTSPTSRLKITINDTFRANYSFAGGGGSNIGLRMNGLDLSYTYQYTNTWTLGGASYGNDFHIPYANVVMTEQLPVGLYDFELVSQGEYTGQFNGTSYVGWGQGARTMLLEEIDGNTYALNQGGDDAQTTSPSYVQAPGRNVTYNKQSASTLLKVTLADTLRVGYAQSPGAGMVIVRMDGVDTVCQIAQSVHIGGGSAATNIHRPFVQTCIISGVAAGNHTFTVWFKSTTGGEAFLGWGRWHRTLLVEELPTSGRSYQTTGTESGDLAGGWAGVPGRQVTHTVSAPGKYVKVTFSDQFRAAKDCNAAGGYYQIFVDGSQTGCYAFQYMWNGGPSPSNNQHYPINHTCVFYMSAGPHVFTVNSTTNWSNPPTSCGSNNFGWNRGQSLILVEELP